MPELVCQAGRSIEPVLHVLWDSRPFWTQEPIPLARIPERVREAWPFISKYGAEFLRIRLAEKYLLLLSVIIYVKNDDMISHTKLQFVSSKIWFIHSAFHSFIRHVGHSSGHSFICLVVAVIIAYCLGVFPPPLLPLCASSRRWRGRRGRGQGGASIPHGLYYCLTLTPASSNYQQ